LDTIGHIAYKKGNVAAGTSFFQLSYVKASISSSYA